jgi:hypothetical protein|tara:strand:- start:11 stop:211 length:201 start_codon:yes stop_codon:yes gene_type:complete
MNQLISADERKRREMLLQEKYQTIILDHIAKANLNNDQYNGLTEKLAETKRLFEDKELFADFVEWK